MKLNEILEQQVCEDCESYEEVFIDTDNNVYDDQYNLLGTTDQFELEEDWGSSDWTAALEMFKKQIEHGVDHLDAAESVAEFYNDDHHNWEKFDPTQLLMMAQRRGILDATGKLQEASVRQWKRFGTEIRKRYRCTSGPKKGKLVADPSKCAGRKDPKKVRQGRKLQRTKKNVIQRKAKISKRKQISKMVTRMNKRLRGEKSGGTMTGGKGKSASTKKSKTTQGTKKTKKTG